MLRSARQERRRRKRKARDRGGYHASCLGCLPEVFETRGADKRESTGIVMNKEECYEVIDECTDAETLEAAQSSQAEVTTCTKSDSTTTQQDPKTATGGIKSHDNNMEKLTSMECDQESNNDTADFTADINLDQFDGQKEVTDEDVMHHLDVIENIELDPETFGVDQCMKETNQSELFTKEREQEEDKDEISVIEEEFPEIKWYEQKLAEKNALLKDRLSKLARVLIVSYPSYEKWLERIEKIEGSPICKIDPMRRCSLKNPNTNRWKFQCRKKSIEESIKLDPDAINVMWQVLPIGIGATNIDNIDIPIFVLKAVKRQQLCNCPAASEREVRIVGCGKLGFSCRSTT